VPEQVKLLIDGDEYAGWKTARVTRSMEAGSGSFDLSVSELGVADSRRRKIRTGSACEVRIGRDRVVSGHVNEVSISLTGDSHSLTCRGRDAVGDLIDCAPDLRDPTFTGPLPLGVMRGEWRDISLLDLARVLAEPFGVTVTAAGSVSGTVAKLFPKVALAPGQRVFELLEEKCRFRQVLPISDGLGGLLLTQAGAANVGIPLVEGQNVLRASATYSEADRFSYYVVKGQSFDQGESGEAAGEAAGLAEDPRVKRHRPLLIMAEQAVDTDACQQRACWEAMTRAGRAVRFQVDVIGWRQPGGGALWPVNRLVTFRSPTLGVDADFLITEVVYTLPSEVTSLSLARRDAFAEAPAVVPPDDTEESDESD